MTLEPQWPRGCTGQPSIEQVPHFHLCISMPNRSEARGRLFASPLSTAGLQRRRPGFSLAISAVLEPRGHANPPSIRSPPPITTSSKRSPRLTRTNSCSATKSWQRGLSRSHRVARGQGCRHGRVHVAAKDEADAANRGGRADVGDEQLYRPLRACAAGGDAAGGSRPTGASKEGPRSDGRADGPHGARAGWVATGGQTRD